MDLRGWMCTSAKLCSVQLALLLAAQLAKYSNVKVTLLERFSRGALPPGLNLLLNHNGMGAIGALDSDLAAAIKAVGDPMISWSAAKMTGESLYRLGDVAAPWALGSGRTRTGTARF